MSLDTNDTYCRPRDIRTILLRSSVRPPDSAAHNGEFGLRLAARRGCAWDPAACGLGPPTHAVFLCPLGRRARRTLERRENLHSMEVNRRIAQKGGSYDCA